MKNLMLNLTCICLTSSMALAQNPVLNVKPVKSEATQFGQGVLISGAASLGLGAISFTGELASPNGGANIGLGLVIFSGAGITASGAATYGISELINSLSKDIELSTKIKSEYRVFKSSLKIAANYPTLMADPMVLDAIQALKCDTCESTQHKIIALNELVESGEALMGAMKYNSSIENKDVINFYALKYGTSFVQKNLGLILDIVTLEFNFKSH